MNTFDNLGDACQSSNRTSELTVGAGENTKNIAFEDLSINADFSIYLTSRPVDGGADFNPGFTINNLTTAEKSVTVFLAAYDIGGKLIDVDEFN